MRYTIYRTKGAVEINSRTEYDDKGNVIKTLCFLGAAPANPDKERTYLWQTDKINIKLGLNDLGPMLAVLTRREKEWKTFHDTPGSDSNKAIALERGDNGYSLRVSEKAGSQPAKAVSVNLSEGDAAILSAIIERTIVLMSSDTS